MGRRVEGIRVFRHGVCSSVDSSINSVNCSSVCSSGSDGRFGVGIRKRGEGYDEIFDGGQAEACSGQKEERRKRTLRLRRK